MGEDRNSSDDGQRLLDKNDKQHKIHLLSVIGEVEGHETLSANTKTTKYEHVLPKLAEIEDSKEVDGLLLLLNTVGGDVESGLAIAEMVPSGTMVIHPVRLSGTVIGAPQTYDYFKQMQDRIIGFICEHCFAKPDQMERLMMNTFMLSKDLGTILVGKEAVEEGIINEVGGMKEALAKLHQMIDAGIK